MSINKHTQTVLLLVSMLLPVYAVADQNIIPDKDDYKVYLTIDYTLQDSIIGILDREKENLQADEILAAVMHSGTGKVLAMASSSRNEPAENNENGLFSFNPKFTAYAYEPGPVIMPLTLAIALEQQQLDPDTFLKTYNGKLEVGNGMIVDHEAFPSLNVTDIVVHSSNIGIAQISWMLSGEEFRDGLQNFGLGSPSGIGLSPDLPGQIKSVDLLNNKLHRANTAYGYGIEATFVQLLKAYSAFNNDGIIVTPRIIDHYTDSSGNYHTLKRNTDTQRVISIETARQIHDILTKVTTRGTGVKAAIPGLEIGGKTGTAHIRKNGKETKEYNSSFYGFANDDAGGKYTIGVLVINAQKKYSYFAAQSAAPLFRMIVEEMVKSGYLLQEEGK